MRGSGIKPGPVLPPGGHWRQYAACRGMDTEMFFGAHPVTTEIVKVCLGCLVRRECQAAADAYEAGEAYVYGIWAGEGPKDRKQRRRAAAASGWRQPGAPPLPRAG